MPVQLNVTVGGVTTSETFLTPDEDLRCHPLSSEELDGLVQGILMDMDKGLLTSNEAIRQIGYTIVSNHKDNQ